MSHELTHLSRVANIAGLNIKLQTPNHHHVLLNERRFHYVEWGTSGNPPLLFLHGGNQSARTWDIVCLALADKFHCIALDQRGHGDSEWSYEGRYAPQDHADDIAALSKHLGWYRFGLIGMSMGGINALSFASRNWSDLTSLVCVDVGPFVQLENTKTLISFVQENTRHPSFDDFVAAALAHNPRRKEDLLRHSLTHTTRELSDGSWAWKMDRRETLNLVELAEQLNKLEATCPNIQCPTLVVRGAESRVFSEKDATRFASLLPNGQLAIVQNSGHTVQGDNPKGLIDVMQNFLPPATT
jgi:pimeloyl-ACP methyl ester carboxylesterase